jgi:uncharacterized protein YacL
MFSTNNLWVTILAVTMGMFFITASVYYVNKLFANSTKDLLVRFILLVFGALVAVFIVDKVMAFGLPLLSVQQNENLFDLIKTLTLMIFSYYFGSQKNSKQE